MVLGSIPREGIVNHERKQIMMKPDKKYLLTGTMFDKKGEELLFSNVVYGREFEALYAMMRRSIMAIIPARLADISLPVTCAIHASEWDEHQMGLGGATPNITKLWIMAMGPNGEGPLESFNPNQNVPEEDFESADGLFSSLFQRPSDPNDKLN